MEIMNPTVAVSQSEETEQVDSSATAADISGWLGMDCDSAIERGDRNGRFAAHGFEFAVFEGRGIDDYRCSIISNEEGLEDLVARSKTKALYSSVSVTSQHANGLGTNRIIFLKWLDEDLRKPCEERRICITKDAFRVVCNTFEVSSAFLEIVLRKNQVGRLGFGCYLHPGQDGRPKCMELSYRYTGCLARKTLDLNQELRYIYTRYDIDTHSSFTLCISPHEKATEIWAGRDPFANHVKLEEPPVGAIRAQENCRSPLAYHILLTRATLEDWKTWMARERKKLISLEREIVGDGEDSDTENDEHEGDAFGDELVAVTPAAKHPIGPRRQGKQLKRLHVLMQRLTVAEGSFKDIEKRIHLCLKAISALRSIPNKSSLWWERDSANKTKPTHRAQSRLSGVTPSTLDRDEQMLQSMLMSCQHSRDWATQYSKRVNIQIQLKFNLLTSRIASEAQRDSSAMITIAVLTMFFLPATFVCSFFGTAFFSDSLDRFHASPQIWIYWVVTIPLTGLVFAVWLVLKTRRDARRARDPDEEGAGHSF